MPRPMVHPRLKRILSESSSAISSPPDTTSDPGKPEPESEDQEPEAESVSHSNQKGSDAEQETLPRVAREYESPGSRMDISDEESGAPKAGEGDKVLVADVNASSETEKPEEDAHSQMKAQWSGSITPLPTGDGGTLPSSSPPSVLRDGSPQPPGPSKSTSRSPSTQSAKYSKELSSVPPSTSVSANRSPASPARPSLKIKLKLGTRGSRVTSDGDANEDKLATSRGSRSRGSGKGKEAASKPFIVTLPPRPRTEPSEASSRRSVSRSQSSQHSSVESEDAEDADAESENENEVGQERGDHIGLDVDAMDVGLELPPMQDLVDDVESEEGDEDIPDDEMDDGGGEDGDSEVLPGGGKARLTARQAVLASMVGADHVELEAATSSRKKQLTSEEIALRREETARKRKNMSEKKLEDEKTETINRLLKKQSSRSRAKRSTLLNSSVVPTPLSPHSGDEAESDAVLGGAPSSTDQRGPGPTIPGPVWRWVSNSAGFRMGVPNEVLSTVPASADEVDASDEMRRSGEFPMNEPPKPRPPAVCDVLGCEAKRKYRLVHDFERGACGMAHLQILKGAA